MLPAASILTYVCSHAGYEVVVTPSLHWCEAYNRVWCGMVEQLFINNYNHSNKYSITLLVYSSVYSILYV